MTMKYEDMIDELKEIIKRLEDRNTDLEESIRLYERGTILLKQCEKVLEEAELKITRLSGE